MINRRESFPRFRHSTSEYRRGHFISEIATERCLATMIAPWRMTHSSSSGRKAAGLESKSLDSRTPGCRLGGHGKQADIGKSAARLHRAAVSQLDAPATPA